MRKPLADLLFYSAMLQKGIKEALNRANLIKIKWERTTQKPYRLSFRPYSKVRMIGEGYLRFYQEGRNPPENGLF